MVAKYVFPVVFLPIDPDQVQNHSPHNLHHKVSYIQITTCHRHSIRKPLFFLVDENTVTTIPKLLFFSGVSKISCRSSLEKSQTLPKVTSGGPLEKALRNKCTTHTGAVAATGHKEMLFCKQGRRWSSQFWTGLRVLPGPVQTVCREGSGCFFFDVFLKLQPRPYQSESDKKKKKTIPVSSRLNPGSYDSVPPKAVWLSSFPHKSHRWWRVLLSRCQVHAGATQDNCLPLWLFMVQRSRQPLLWMEVQYKLKTKPASLAGVSWELGRVSFQPESARLLHGGQHLLIQHWEGRVRWQVQPVETGVSSGERPQEGILDIFFLSPCEKDVGMMWC